MEERQDIEIRFTNLTDINAALNFKGMSIINNIALELNRLMDELDFIKLEEYEAAWGDYQSINSKKEVMKSKIKKGMAKRKLACDLIDFITGHLDDTKPSREDLDAVRLKLQPVLVLLQMNATGDAKAIIDALEVDSVLTQEVKDDINDIYQIHGQA